MQLRQAWLETTWLETLKGFILHIMTHTAFMVMGIWICTLKATVKSSIPQNSHHHTKPYTPQGKDLNTILNINKCSFDLIPDKFLFTFLSSVFPCLFAFPGGNLSHCVFQAAAHLSLVISFVSLCVHMYLFRQKRNKIAGLYDSQKELMTREEVVCKCVRQSLKHFLPIT